MKAVGYVRVSTTQQAANGHSLDAQRQKVRQYCDLYDLDLVGIHADEGASGKDLDRDGLTEALCALSDGDADTLVVVKLDRLTRSVADLNRLLEEHFTDGGSEIVSVSENVDTSTPAGRLVLNMLMSVSQWEREVISQRTSDAMQHMRQERKFTGTAPYGWTVSEDGETLVEDEDEQALIHAVLRYREAGLSYRAIAAELAADGYANRKGNAFHASTIGNIIRNNDLEDFTDANNEHTDRSDAEEAVSACEEDHRRGEADGGIPEADTDEHQHQASPINHEEDDEEDTDGVSATGNLHRGGSRSDHRTVAKDDPTALQQGHAESSRRRQRDAVPDQPSGSGSLVA
jgi:DNA invertase Pin-like site-specific DNA recombinase